MSRNLAPIRSRVTTAAMTVLCAATSIAGVTLAAAGPASAAPCSAVDVSFARGTAERPGVGLAGGPFISSVTSNLPGKTVSTYAVNYAANISQTSAGAGSTDLVNHLNSVSASCPSTVFVLGGYSQGATVVDKALGIRTTTGGSGGTVIPAALAPKVKAMVVFGNPLGLQRQTIATASATYGPRSKDYCNTGDPVCGGGGNFVAHLAYGSNGMATAGGVFAAGLVTAAIG